MSHALQSEFGTRVDSQIRDAAGSNISNGLQLCIYDRLADVEQDWRAFEQVADCTAFQSFEWLSLWQLHIGRASGVVPVIVTGRDAEGGLLFLLPLAIDTSGAARRLTWLGTDLCDYNGPMLAPDFSKRIDASRFEGAWREILERLQGHPNLSFDLVHLEKMPEVVGTQQNPFIAYGVFPHPNHAYRTDLRHSWEDLYREKRSSATRRRDRMKRTKLSNHGDVQFSSLSTPGEIDAALDTLMRQKSKAFAAMGVNDIFLRRGHRDFYFALAGQNHFAHVSRLNVGDITAAVNLGLVFRGRYYHVLVSYDADREFSKLGPGIVHLHELLRYAIAQGYSVFDFSIGDARYKQEWSDTRITLFDHVSPATLRGCPVALAIYGTVSAKRIVKQTPALWNIATKVRAIVGSRLSAAK